MSNNRGAYLIKNTALFALGSMGTKLIAFFLVPLYTHMLSTSQYGSVDLVASISSVLMPILILNISEAVMRFSLDKGADQNAVMSIGLSVFIVAAVVGLLIIPVARQIEMLRDHAKWIYFYVISMAGSQIFLCLLRGQERLLQYSVGNIIHALSVALLNILYLVVLNQGMTGYFKAYVLSNFAVMLYVFFAGNVWQVVKSFRFDSVLFRAMAKFSVVLIPNSMMWWIINSSSRIMLTAQAGAAENGIYAIANKVPALVSTVANIFSQAWMYTAIKESDQPDKDQYSSSVFQGLAAIMLIIVSGVLLVIKDFLRVYVDADYYSAWRYVPLLILGTLFLVLSTFVGTSYTVNKDSKGFLLSASCGAAVHLAVCLVLIPDMGAFGAAIAACASYLAIFAYRVWDTRKYVKLKLLTPSIGIGIVLIMIQCYIIYSAVAGWRVWLFGLFLSVAVLFSKVWIRIIKSVLLSLKGVTNGKN